MADLGAYFGNPNLQRQGARGRALAGQRDVNTLADPRTYAVVQGLLGTAPDEMGFSVLNPDYEKIKKAAEPAFALGLLGQAAPMLAPLTKGLPVGASIKTINLNKAIYKPDLTMDEMLKVRDIPTVERMQQSVGLVGEKEFEKMVNAQYLKYKPTTPEQEAMLVESVTLDILGRAQRSDVLPVMQQRIAPTPETGLLGQEVTDYRGSHQAPSSDFGAPLYDLTGGGQMYPADVYSSKAAQFYGGGVPYDQKAFSIAQQYKDKPDALVTIYRAVPKEASNSEKLATLEKQMSAYMKRGTLPKDADNYSNGSKWYDAAYDERDKLRKMSDEPNNDISTINAGDWVTLTKEYAKDHGESALKGEYKILSKKVKAKEVWTNADSIHEFGYQPQASAVDEQKRKQITSLLE